MLTLFLLSVSLTDLSKARKSYAEQINLLNCLKVVNFLAVTVVNFLIDTNSSEWFINTVAKLVDMNGIGGYPDGTFRPNEVMQRGAFTKILIATMGYNEGMDENEYWAMNNVRRAEQLGILDKNEYPESTLDNPITRYEAAKMLARALELQGETFNNSIYDYAQMIKDYNSILAKYKDYVLKVYSNGIIAGYPDGTFKGDNKLTRAEGSSMIIRLFDESERVKSEKINKQLEIKKMELEMEKNKPKFNMDIQPGLDPKYGYANPKNNAFRKVS